MWNAPTENQLNKLPPLYATENLPVKHKLIMMHFFIGGCDWYVAEYSDGIFFGFAIINGDLQNAEWGYSSLDEMKAVSVNGVEIDRDRHWDMIAASDVPEIVKAGGIH